MKKKITKKRVRLNPKPFMTKDIAVKILAAMYDYESHYKYSKPLEDCFINVFEKPSDYKYWLELTKNDWRSTKDLALDVINNFR